LKIANVSPYITSTFESEKFYNIQAIGLATELVKKGISVDIYTGSPQKSLNGQVREIYVNNKSFFRIYYLPTKFVFAGQIPVITSLIKMLKGNNYDLIQTSEDFQLTTLELALFRKSLNTPLVIFQGVYTYTYRKILRSLQELFDKTINKNIIMPNVDLVITKTKTAEKFMQKKGYKRVITIPVGIHSDKFSPKDKSAFRDEIGISNEDPLLLYVGRLEPYRDLLTLIRSMKVISRDFPTAKLLIVGKGSLEDKIRIISNHNKNIILLGKIPNSKMPWVYSAADITLLPMKKTCVFTFGMVILESMACGTPVISVPVPGAKDILNVWRNGILVPFEDHKTLADAVITLLENEKLRKKMGENARKIIERNYDWRVLVKKYIKAYKSVIGD